MKVAIGTLLDMPKPRLNPNGLGRGLVEHLDFRRPVTAIVDDIESVRDPYFAMLSALRKDTNTEIASFRTAQEQQLLKYKMEMEHQALFGNGLIDDKTLLSEIGMNVELPESHGVFVTKDLT